MTSLRLRLATGALIVIAALAYLRDPPWLAGLTSGLGPVEADGRGTRWRTSTGGHASFFVPADARTVEFPIRIAFDTPLDWPVTAIVTLDDVPVERVVLTDESWRAVRFTLPPPGSRKVRRVDVRVDRTRGGNRGPQIGEARPMGRQPRA
jgi:hypothetical protein